MRTTLLAVLLLSCMMAPGETKSKVAVFISGPENTGATAQEISTLHGACPNLLITANADSADYLVVWDSKTWQQTTWGGHQQEFVITNRAGEVVGSGKAHRISNAAKDLCKVLSALPERKP